VKSEGERLLGKLYRIWEDNIRMEFKDREWENMDWTIPAHDRDKRGWLL
jgi:hypothetical protein